MIIQTVKTMLDGYLVNGGISVPSEPSNRHYQAILDWINEGNTPEGPDVIEPDYVALRTGPDGYASVGDQLGMQTDGTWDAHVADVKARFPKTITGGTTIGDVPTEIMEAADAKQAAGASVDGD
jgi:ABC-type glycerol-3-phosphate transport system substrate-binding protein